MSSVVTFSYDGDWKRLKKVVATNTTDYYYDDMQLAEIRQIGTTGQVTQTESLVYDTRYLHSVVYRDVYSGLTATLVTRHALLNDANFNVTALVSTNGAVVERYTYDPYGKVTIRDTAWQPITWDASQKNVYLYTGHKFDAESGLYYSLYRYYHPGLGRWASRDPLLEVRDGLAVRGFSGKDFLERHTDGFGYDVNGRYSGANKRGDRSKRQDRVNLYDSLVNSPLNITDLLGLLDKAEYIKKGTVDDFQYFYGFFGKEEEDLIQIDQVDVEFVCKENKEEKKPEKKCSYSAVIPERFRLESGGGKRWDFLYDEHTIEAQHYLGKYCTCICKCCDSGTFKVTIDLKLFHGKGITVAGSGNYAVLDSVTLASGNTLFRSQSVTDCDGKKTDVSSKFTEDWSMTPIGGTGTIGGEKTGVFRLTHNYDGKFANTLTKEKKEECSVTEHSKPKEEDYK